MSCMASDIHTDSDDGAADKIYPNLTYQDKTPRQRGDDLMRVGGCAAKTLLAPSEMLRLWSYEERAALVLYISSRSKDMLC